MIMLKNHFDGNDTCIVGKFIVNGCQCFPVEKLDEIAEIFFVPIDIVEQVRELTLNNSTEDWQEAIKHPYWKVRVAVARQGYGLDVLVKDEDWRVRMVVAEQGYDLDVLVVDEDWRVRVVVAEQGYGLDVLVVDEDWSVKVAVAEQGYGLDVLVMDEDCNVRAAAKRKLQELSK